MISRFVGGTWTNNYMIFSGIGFERQEDRLRTVEWEVDGENCTTTLTAGERKVTLRGQHIGGGVVKFDAMGLPFEYKFHQVGRDTLLVSRTEDSSCAESAGRARRPWRRAWTTAARSCQDRADRHGQLRADHPSSRGREADPDRDHTRRAHQLNGLPCHIAPT